MRKIYVALAAVLFLPTVANAQSVPSLATVVLACGTPPSTYAAGQNRPVTQDTTGSQCTNGSGGGATSNVNITQVGGNAVTTAVPVSAASLPLPSGAATSANQSSVQSAPGTPQTTANTIQGNASGIPVPVSGTVTATPGISVGAPTNRGGTITTGGTSQTLASSNGARKCLIVYNPVSATGQGIAAAESVFVNDNAVAATVNGGGNYAELTPGASTTFCPNSVSDQTTVTINAATTGHVFGAKEFQ